MICLTVKHGTLKVLQLTNYLGRDDYHNGYGREYIYFGVGWSFIGGNNSGMFGDSPSSASYRDGYSGSQC